MMLKKIVVAEDDDAIAHMVNMALGDAGFLCMRARDGEEALSLVRLHSPDLLVLDVMMPRMDGYEVARKLKTDVILSKVPVLMLTALTDVDCKVKGLDAGADDYLTKPFDLRELSARVRALIRANRRERDRNPTTDLPGSAAIDDKVNEVLEGDGAAAIVHLSVAGFDGYADLVGFARAEELVAAIGKLALAEARRHGDCFLGHLGGVDFVAVLDAERVEEFTEKLMAAFGAQAGNWTEEGQQELSMVAGIVSTSSVDNGEQLVERLASAVREAKHTEGSNYVVWKPEAV